MVYPKIGIRPVIDGRWGGVREGLEEQTMNMARAAAKLIGENVFYQDGTPAQCVIGETTIGSGAEAARVAAQFAKENVCATLSVTPCWCYGSETMDLDPLTIKAVWGFNGTERPGAVYLAAVMAAHAQRGLPAFSIYGHDVQDKDDTSVPADVREKILRFARCAVAVGQMKNKAYVNLGGVSMGIAGAFCDANFMQKYLGIRAEWVDLTEILRRMTLEIYDHDEYEKALAWMKANCKEGFDKNAGKDLPEIIRKSKVVPADKDWEFIAKFTVIVNDILHGNEKLAEMGWHEESLGRNAVVGGFQGQRMCDQLAPERRLYRVAARVELRLEREKAAVPLCNGERHAQRYLHAVCHAADEQSALLPRRTDVLEPRRGGARDGQAAHRQGAARYHPPHQLRCDGDGLHRRGQGRGRQRHGEALVGHDGRGHRRMPRRDRLVPRRLRVFPRRRLLVAL